tara:strand:+ start:92 stop:841 length:750 start_codon:yes stop_codon:yes gene_type:complete
MKIFKLSFLFNLLISLSFLPSEIFPRKLSANQFNPTEPITISVKDVKDRSNSFVNDKNWSRRISNILINELTSTGHFSVIESDPDIISTLKESNLNLNNNKKVINSPRYLIYASLNDFVEVSSTGGGAGIGFLGFSTGKSSGNLTYYISFDLKVINAKTGTISFSRTIEGEATADIKGNNFSYTSLAGVSLDKDNLEITGMNPTRVIRSAIQEISAYLDCVLYLQDECLVQFDAKDQRRIKSNESLNMF